MTKSAARSKDNRTPRKEAFFVSVEGPDNTLQFFPATEHVGRPMPFKAPRETCAIRVYDDVISFSLLHLTKKNSKTVAGKPVAMPASMLTRLSRRALELGEFPPGRVVVENGEELHEMKMTVSDAKVASLEAVGDEPLTTLDVRGQRVSTYFRSPTSGHIIALGFIGHMGKPGTPETVVRLAAKSLNAATRLSAFRVPADFETVEVPSRPGLSAVPAGIKAARYSLPVKLFSEEREPVAAGEVLVDIDMQHSNPSTGSLLFTLSPEDGIAEHFEPYREICTNFVGSQMVSSLGDEMRSITMDIIVGDVEQTTVDRLLESLSSGMPGVDMTPTQFRVHSTS